MATKQTYEKWTVFVKRIDGLSFEKLDLLEEVEMTADEAEKENESSHQNGIRYYAKG